MRILSLLILVFLPFSAWAQDNPILQRMSAFVQAYNAQDVATIASFYSSDAVLLPPKEKALVGRDAIAAHYARAFAAGAKGLQSKTFDIRPINSAAAVEVGETVVNVGAQRVVGRYMHIWQIEDGQLLLTRDMYHLLKIE